KLQARRQRQRRPRLRRKRQAKRQRQVRLLRKHRLRVKRQAKPRLRRKRQRQHQRLLLQRTARRIQSSKAKHQRSSQPLRLTRNRRSLLSRKRKHLKAPTHHLHHRRQAIRVDQPNQRTAQNHRPTRRQSQLIRLTQSSFLQTRVTTKLSKKRLTNKPAPSVVTLKMKIVSV